MKVEIGAYEAKTRLPELLQQVKAGRQFTITNRGKAIADLVPSQKSVPKDKAAAIERFRKFMQTNPVRAKMDIAQLIKEGRM